MFKVQIEKLASHDKDTFIRATSGAAAFDLVSCLTRPCRDLGSGTFFPWKAQRVKANPGETIFGFIDRVPAEKALFAKQEKKLRENQLLLKIAPGETVRVPLGVATAFPHTHVALLFTRASSATKQFQLGNCVGVIDADYRGEWYAAIRNNGQKDLLIPHGERIVQVIFVELPDVEFDYVAQGGLPTSERGEGGFGSTDGKPAPPAAPAAIEGSPDSGEFPEPEFGSTEPAAIEEAVETPVAAVAPAEEEDPDDVLYEIALSCGGSKVGPIVKVRYSDLEAIANAEGKEVETLTAKLAGNVAGVLRARADKVSEKLVTALVERMFKSEGSTNEAGATA